MNNFKHVGVLYVIIALLLATIWIMYEDRPSQDKIVTDEIIGSFTDKDPKPIKHDSVYVYSLRDTLIKYYNPVDTVYVNKYVKVSDVEKTEMYLDAIGQRNYKDTLDNQDIVISYDLNTIGRLSDISFDYAIKPMEIEIPKPKETVFALYGGASLQSTTDLNKLEVMGNIGLQNKSGDIFTVGYGLNNTVQVGYSKRIFRIQK